MNVLVVSGIWPPDIGGPATHVPEVAEFLRGRGHTVVALTTASGTPARLGYPVHRVARDLPAGVCHAVFAARLARLARGADVIYTNSVLNRSAAGAAVSRTPYVAKLTDDPAYERARRRGLFDGDLDAFQRFGGGVLVRALRAVRDAALRHAAHVVCPSDYLREIAIGWGVRADRITVLANPMPAEQPHERSRDDLRLELALDGPALAFAGRLTDAKALDVALEAVARLEGVSLLVAGDGPDRESLERRSQELALDGRVRFLGSLQRDHVLELFRAVDGVVLPSRWENLPHVLVEALAVGTPVVATRVGGVEEVVVDGENGLLVPSEDAQALAQALGRLLGDGELRERLRGRATGSVEGLTPESVYARLERVLVGAAGA